MLVFNCGKTKTNKAEKFGARGARATLNLDDSEANKRNSTRMFHNSGAVKGQ